MLDVGDGLNLPFEEGCIFVADVGVEVHFEGDALLHVAGGAVDVVLHKQTQPQEEHDEGDAENGGGVCLPQVYLAFAHTL